ncbi:MAG: hypothetical protein ACRC1K_06755 [Planctomycetia bacterium]
MSADPTVDDSFVREQRQLYACAWSLWLIAAGLVTQFMVVFMQLATFDSRENQAQIVAPALVDYFLELFYIAATQLPGTIILTVQARSRRWRTASILLLVSTVLGLGCVFLLSQLRTPDVPIVDVEPLVVRGLLHAREFLHWFDFWWIAVLAAEFAIACRAYRLVEKSEVLGTVILAGVSINLAAAAWMLPRPLPLDRLDDLSKYLLMAEFFLGWIATLWLLNLLLASASLARFLAARCSDAAAAAAPVADDP